MAFTGNEHHDISFEDAGVMTKRYRDKMSTNPPSSWLKGGFFGRAAIETLLAQENCVGIRYYYGLDENNIQVLVLVGTDSDEDDLVGKDNQCMEMSVPCPDRCGTNNILNSGT